MKIICIVVFYLFTINKLSLNTTKTVFSVFTKKRDTVLKNLRSITANNATIKRVGQTKYLGITLDEDLTWNQHTQALCKQLTSIASTFKIFKNKLPKNHLMQLYNAYFHSKVTYGLEIYGNTKKANLNRIQKIQNRALKILFNMEHLTPTKEVHSNTRKLMINDLYTLQINKFTYKFINNYFFSYCSYSGMYSHIIAY